MINEFIKRFNASVMAHEFIANNMNDFLAVSSFATDHFEGDGGTLKFVATRSQGTGKWGMARLWRKWMKETATYMANNGSVMPRMIRKDGSWYGRRPFNENDAHELFTVQWLGTNAKGERLSWVKSDGENVADKGQRFLAMLKHQEWCMQKGIILTLPRDSEFNELQEQQNK